MAVPAVAASYFYRTGPGKLSVWNELLDGLDLRGDENVLDIGCGRGAVLISAAHRLPRGRATGADICRLRDQTGNSRKAAERNAMVGAVRVLRPGGQMRVVDEGADRYAPILRGAGCVDVEMRRLDWRTWSGLPGHHFTLVSARRPAAGAPQLAGSGRTAGGRVHGAGPLPVTRCTHTKAQARAGVLVLGLHSS
jgi:arsenite methyltransferase